MRRARQGSIGKTQASSARAPARAVRMAPPRVSFRMVQATTLTARPARGSSPAAIPQTSRLPSRHLTRNQSTTLSPSTNAHQQVVRYESNWQGSRMGVSRMGGTETFKIRMGGVQARSTPPRQGSWRWCSPRTILSLVRGLRLHGERGRQ